MIAENKGFKDKVTEQDYEIKKLLKDSRTIQILQKDYEEVKEHNKSFKTKVAQLEL